MKRSAPLIFLAINAACALVMLFAAHRVAAVMTLEQRTVPDAVDGVTFFTGSASAWAIAALTNVAWLCLASVDLVRRRNGKAFWWIGGSVAIWGIAFATIRTITS